MPSQSSRARAARENVRAVEDGSGGSVPQVAADTRVFETAEDAIESFSGELVPGCGIRHEDYLALGFLSPSNTPLPLEQVARVVPNAQAEERNIFRLVGLDVSNLDHVVSDERLVRQWATPESARDVIRSNRGFAQLKYLPLLQHINVYTPTRGFVYTLNMVDVRSRCACCDKLELSFDHPGLQFYDELFARKREDGTHCLLKSCARCRSAQYCSRECQVAHWKTHKPYCTHGHS